MSRLVSLFVVVIAACGGRGPDPARPAPGVFAGQAPAAADPTAAAPLPIGAAVLLGVTGYGGERDDIKLADLTRDYCSGAIAVLEPVRAVADAKLGCAAPTVLATLPDFLPTAKTGLLVTDLDHVTAQFKAIAVDGAGFFSKPDAYPLVAGPRPETAAHLTHFIMTGVTAITRATGAACDTHGIAWLTEKLRPEFESADYVHISNEVSLKADCVYPLKKTYTFCTKESDFQALIDLRANVIELTGNHNRDFGDEPFKKTLEWYRAHDMKTFGGGASPEEANEPIVLTLAGDKKLGIVGFNEQCPLKECAIKPGEVGANAYDAAKAKAAIERLRGELGADFVLVTVQFREWDKPEPTKTQARISRELIDQGADLVYGSQAHQLQHVEFYKGKPIFHGLGNLLFDQVHRVGVRQAFFVHHFFFDGKLVQSVPVFTYMSDERQPTLATPDQAAEMKQVVFHDDLLYQR
jgi:poly-gamma-glutamate capsule biosynthesis protein CapA/YwtB (metallophosphatase superfamily)